MAQLVAHHTGSVGVRGSNPLSSTFGLPIFSALPLVVVARGFVVSIRVVVGIAGGVALASGGSGGEWDFEVDVLKLRWGLLRRLNPDFAQAFVQIRVFRLKSSTKDRKRTMSL